MSVTIYGYKGDHPAVEFTEAEANFANGNFVLIAQHLGYQIDPCDLVGYWWVRDLKQRCVTASAVGGQLSDDGMPGAEHGGPGTGMCRMIDVGLRPGYFADAVAAIEAVADECIARGIDRVTYA